MTGRHVLVVCTANQCRSPMAAGLMRARARTLGLEGDLEVLSAGTWAAEGIPATDHAASVMANRSIDLTSHRSREVDDALMEWADLVLVMTDSHRQALIADFPDHRQKVRLMSGLVGGKWDIADPVGGSRDEYEATARELERLVDDGWSDIVGEAASVD